MGGYGSGRNTVEDCRQLDINRFARDNLINHNPFVWAWWSDEGERKASINIYPGPDGVRLTYTSTIHGEKKDLDYFVPIVYARVGYGDRPYFLCPICGSRCLKLYLNSQYFTCRKCANLTYESTREKAPDRAMRKATKIRRKIGASLATIDYISPADKPKRMRWKTFNRLKAQAEHYEAMGWGLMDQYYSRLKC